MHKTWASHPKKKRLFAKLAFILFPLRCRARRGQEKYRVRSLGGRVQYILASSEIEEIEGHVVMVHRKGAIVCSIGASLPKRKKLFVKPAFLFVSYDISSFLFPMMFHHFCFCIVASKVINIC